jgi:hypothetical protein
VDELLALVPERPDVLELGNHVLACKPGQEGSSRPRRTLEP